MIDTTLEIIQKGMCKEVTGPLFGKQHQGIAPGGAMDLFSFRMGNALLQRDLNAVALEIVIAPVCRFKRDCWFVLTGARYDRVTITTETPGNMAVIEHGAVCRACAGDTLTFGTKVAGFRTYLAAIPVDHATEDLSRHRRPDYTKIYGWSDPKGKIRLLEGPEYDYLTDKTVFINHYWVITNDFSDMGFRLQSRGPMPAVTLKNMISEAVADGTIQLTPKGPIVLLKHRQTVGGYPRIFNVISADVDLLAQYAPQQILHFSMVTLDEALAIAQAKATAFSQMITSHQNPTD